MAHDESSLCYSSWKFFNSKCFSNHSVTSFSLHIVYTVLKEKLAGVVYQIHCQCGKVYVGETQRRLEMLVKEHRDACTRGGYLEICHCGASVGSATPSRLGGTRVLDRATS